MNQSSGKMKKVLAISLAILFVVSLTAVTASACGGGNVKENGESVNINSISTTDISDGGSMNEAANIGNNIADSMNS